MCVPSSCTESKGLTHNITNYYYLKLKLLLLYRKRKETFLETQNTKTKTVNYKIFFLFKETSCGIQTFQIYT